MCFTVYLHIWHTQYDQIKQNSYSPIHCISTILAVQISSLCLQNTRIREFLSTVTINSMFYHFLACLFIDARKWFKNPYTNNCLFISLVEWYVQFCFIYWLYDHRSVDMFFLILTFCIKYFKNNSIQIISQIENYAEWKKILLTNNQGVM